MIIPRNVTIIGHFAFAMCEKLTSLVIPKSVTTIGTRAFNSCIKLKSLFIPNSVMIIEHEAFNDCPSTCDIHFDKTKAEVYAMEEYPWGICKGAIIHCTDGDLTVR